MNDTFALFFVTWAFISVTLFFVYVTLMKRCNAGMLKYVFTNSCYSILCKQ